MGCDIHAMIEKEDDYGWWTNAGGSYLQNDMGLCKWFQERHD